MASASIAQPTATSPSPTGTQPSTAGAASNNPSSSTNNSLYVGDLAADVTEAMLFEIFNQIGLVASIHVCRDAVTRRSLGYAYVNFHNPADCERAIDQLNFSDIKGKQCRIMWSQRDPSNRKKGSGNIFIKNLDKAIDSKALHDTFSSFGNILSCKVAMDENGSRGYGFVHYDSDEAAFRAIQAVNGMLLNDKKVFVGLHVPRRERDSKEEEIKNRFTNVFVKNLPESVDDEKFEEMFKKHGAITSAALTKDENGKSRCFGFVNFEDHEAAAEAVKELNGKEMDGKLVFAGRAQKKSEREDELRRKFEQMRIERISKYQGVNLYVKNLDDSIDDEQLRQAFSPFGTITSTKVMHDEKGQSRGFAFVCFSAPEEATKAVTEMNGKILGAKPVYVALAQRKETRRAMLENQHSTRSQMRMQPGMIPMYGAPLMYPPTGPGGMPGQMPPQGFVYPGQLPPGVRPGMPPPPYATGMPPFPAGALPPQALAAAAAAAAAAAGGSGSVSGGGVPPTSMPPQQGGQPQGPPQQRMPRQPGGQAGRGRGGYYNQQQQRPVYNQQQQPPQINRSATGPRPQPPQQAQQSQQQGAKPQQRGQPLTAAALAKLEPAQQRQAIGERLYPLVQSHSIVQSKHKDMAGKLTGMLLEMEVGELLHLLENNEAFMDKMTEAIAVLEQYLEQQTKQQ